MPQRYYLGKLNTAKVSDSMVKELLTYYYPDYENIAQAGSIILGVESKFRTIIENHSGRVLGIFALTRPDNGSKKMTLMIQAKKPVSFIKAFGDLQKDIFTNNFTNSVEVETWCQVHDEPRKSLVEGLGFKRWLKFQWKKLDCTQIDKDLIDVHQTVTRSADIEIIPLKSEIQFNSNAKEQLFLLHKNLIAEDYFFSSTGGSELEKYHYLMNTNPEFFFIAKDRNEMIGESFALRAWGSPKTTLIQSYTGILPEYRGLGIGSTIKLNIIESAIAAGIKSIYTKNLSTNGPIAEINGRLGFKVMSDWQGYLMNA